MLVKHALGLASYIGFFVSASPVVRRNDSINAMLTVLPSSEKLLWSEYQVLPSKGSNTSLSLPSGTDPHIQCDGVSYGFDLDIEDCEEAKAYIPVDSEQFQLAERHTGWRKKILPLPYRVMGSKASCYVQPVLIDGVTSAKASLNEVRNAAAAIRGKCVSGGKLQGGMATNIGGDNNLAVIMGGYKSPSKIQCSGSFAYPPSCDDVLDDMPATVNKEVFGNPAQKSATVQLPQAVESDDGRCMLRIFMAATDLQSDIASWYQIWEATNALWALCTRQHLGGGMSGIGDRGALLVALTNPPKDSSLSLAEKAPIALLSSKYYGGGILNHGKADTL